MGDLVNWILVSIVQFVVGKRFYVAAYRALRHGSTNMDVLVVLGTTASYVYSVCALLYGAFTGFQPPIYFATSAMIITFVLFGEYLEVLAKGKTSDAIKKLVELVPATAILLLKDKGKWYTHITVVLKCRLSKTASKLTLLFQIQKENMLGRGRLMLC